MELDKKNIDELSISRTPKKNTCYLSLNNYEKKLKNEYINCFLSKYNVLCIFSYSLKYMNKNNLNKWLKENINAPFYDTHIPKKKPIAYIRFKNSHDLKIFEKMIENKKFNENDNMSLIKISKTPTNAKKRKLENKNVSIDKKKKRSEKQKDNSKIKLLDLYSIIKINKNIKNKSIQNYVTPFYNYKYVDQVKIKQNFLKKCADKILMNLLNKIKKEQMIFNNIFSNNRNNEEKNSLNNSLNKNSVKNEENNTNIINDHLDKYFKKYQKNETSNNSCLKNCVLKNINENKNKNESDILTDKKEKYKIKIDEPVFPDLDGIYGYRNKCEFTIAYDENNNVEIGFVVRKLKTTITKNEKNTNDDNCNFSENNISSVNSPINETQNTIDRNEKKKQTYYLNPIVEKIDHCVHINQCMKDVVHKMKEVIKESNFPIFDRVYKTGVWRLLVIRTSSKKQMMIIVQTYLLDQKKKKEIKKLLINKLTKTENESFMTFSGYKVVSLYLQEHESANDSTDQSVNEHLWGDQTLEETFLNNQFILKPSCFLQINHMSCELLYKKITEYLNIKKDKMNYIFDLCCGVGTIGITVLNNFNDDNVHLIGIEISEESIKCAKKNAEINNIKNYKFIQGRIEDQLLNEMKLIDNKSNVIIIVDPPRCGLANKCINVISSNDLISQIVYVSCNPITLIQNVTDILFHNENMIIDKMGFVDMFPHTFHVECIVNILQTS